MRSMLLASVTALSLAVAACGGAEDSKTGTPAQPAEAGEPGGGQTIAAGLAKDGRFSQAAQAAGLDATLSGPGPYTVLVPSDAAFDKLPAGALDALMKPEGRAELTRLLTFHVLPGTILAADIGKAIDQGGGKAQLPTMEGATLTATRDGDKIVIADSAGGKAVVTAADDKRSNGVIHRVDGVLMPAR